MRTLFVSLALALASLPVLAQSGSPSLRNSVAIQRMKFERGTTPFTQKAGQFRAPRKVFGAQSQYASAITRLADGKTVEDVKAEGVHVLRTIGDFVFIAMPLEDAARVAALPLFKFFEFDRKVDHKMCYARQATGVNTIHQGIGLSQAYTGKGVVCGIVDNGFDVNHVNFLDANGEPRVKYFEIVRTNPNATSIDDYFTFKYYNTPAEIKELTTDNAQTYHGTHTMGIMAGGYSGQTKAALLEDADSGVKAVVKEGISNPYYGMAYESDIIAGTAMNMTSMEIAQAVADLAYYQVYANQPDQTTGKVSSFTSYGTLSDGRNLPHVLGPGAYVISSMNRYYLQAAGAAGNEEILSAVAETDNRDPFGWSAGTSMACPAVTGIIALWLEADPTLTMDEIKEIIAQTAKKTDDMVDEDPEQIGAGLIDAYEGLKEVLRRKQGADGIQQVGADENRLVVSAAGHRKVNVFVAGEKSLNMEVFNVSGARVAQAKALGDEGTIDLTGLAKGTYVIRVNGRLSKCVLVQ